MGAKLSTSDATEILRKVASGQSVQRVSKDLDIPESIVTQFIRQAQLELLPNKKPSPRRYRLTHKDRAKGGKASQNSRQLQRNAYAKRVAGLINTKIKTVEMATCFYWLLSGSGKGFSITIPNVECGILLYRGLAKIGVPDKSIAFNWRCAASQSEQIIIRQQWKGLGSLIRFPEHGASKSLRLNVSPFKATDENGSFKVSSRGLAQAFLKIGQQMVIDAARR